MNNYLEHANVSVVNPQHTIQLLLTALPNWSVRGKGDYTQVTSRCRIQSVVIDSSSRKTTQRNSQLFPSCLTQQSGQ
ncbi:hypothetical protein EGH82_15930 [Vibrio ponticus]|uniref:Uncharacterized protein n=1 Tax=Vibrio ponticus TaxID=265668 RepID=A0A3N3DX84_9VIBR|nr:hypothetical protein EGH82_15930 [Vibrio ponticus]